MDTTSTTAREYLRVSQDKSGHLQSPKEQHQDNERAAAGNGWTLGEPYREAEGISASRYSTRARAAFDELTADLTAGRFGAQILILWESSRGSRRVGEWVSLIEACEAAGVQVHVTSQERTYNPAKPHDRKTLLTDAVDSEYASGKQSLEICRAAAAHAAEGKPHGRVPYGYRREFRINERGKREFAGQFPEPAEAAVVEELYRRLRQGHSLRSIAADFEARGIRTRTGKVFAPQHLREMALMPAYAGLRVHQASGHRGHRDKASLDGAVQALWDGLVDAETFHGVHNMLTAPERRTSRPGRAVHLLSMIAACGACGGPLTVRYRRDGRDYHCRERACVTTGADELDRYAEAVMLAYLARPDVIAQLRASREDDGGKLSAVRGELAAERGELAELRAAGKSRRMSVATVMAIEPGIVATIAGLERRERELAAPPALAGLLAPGKDAAARWKDAPMPARRQAARLLCSPGILGQLRVGRDPAPGRRRTDPADRVTWGTGQ